MRGAITRQSLMLGPQDSGGPCPDRPPAATAEGLGGWGLGPALEQVRGVVQQSWEDFGSSRATSPRCSRSPFGPASTSEG
jgi:hypothetical protein